MTSSLIILGRQPALGVAELESLYGSSALRPIGDTAIEILKSPEHIDFQRLGGSVKLCQILTTLPATDWKEIESYLIDTIPKHLHNLPDGKLQLGLSVYGFRVRPQQLMTTGLTLKKVIKSEGRSVRLVPNKEPALNSAQVIHNNLTGPLGWELVFVRDGAQTLICQTVAEQDIEAYAARDQQRPMRDTRVGMLPPKLAQIILNLALAQTTSVDAIERYVLDPFCGTGVILQEALLMDYGIRGSDLDERMVEYTVQNLHWLDSKRHVLSQTPQIEVADATSYSWTPSPITIACETYLGRPFSAQPDARILREVIEDVNTIHKKFLRNVSQQIISGFRMCIAVPAWKTKNSLLHLPVLDHLEELGYNRVSFVHAGAEELIYHRSDQIVARELVVLERK